MGDEKWQKVLVLQTSFLGDTVLTLPLLNAIKRCFPGTKLNLLCSPHAKELLQDQLNVDEIIVDDKKGADKGWSGLWRQAKKLRQRGFTLAISPHKSLRSALLLFLARIPCRVGFSQSKGWFLYNSRTKRTAENHDVERNLSILKALGINLASCQRSFELGVTPRSQQTVDHLFQSLGLDKAKFLVGINPGSAWPTKRWMAEGFARVVELLKRKYDCDVALFGGPDDTAVTEKIESLCRERAVNLAGKISLRELPAAISRCRLFITNDSGPMHIAVARDIPTVVIFCATTPSLGFYPYSSKAVVVETALPCRPCSSHGGRRCPLGTEDCIRRVSPDRVMEAVEKLLRNEEAGQPPNRDVLEPEFMVV
jgi:heptosyltransferase-2